MPLHLPNLDDLQWKDLVAEGRALIPSWADEWTNHNPSDPGMTLLELFAYVSGTLMYQLNRITDSDTAAFLSLVNGTEWKSQKGIAVRENVSSAEYRSLLRDAVSDREKRHTLRSLVAPARAVTAEDFAFLAGLVPGVDRITTLPRVNLENADPASRWQECAGHISVVVLCSDEAANEVLANVRLALEPARLLTTRIHVVRPRFVPLRIRLTVTADANVHSTDSLRQRVADKVARFFDPRQGWFDGTGWPFGRGLYISELYQVIGETPGVSFVSAGRGGDGALEDELIVEAPFASRVIRSERGTIQELRLLPDELFHPAIGEFSITVARHR